MEGTSAKRGRTKSASTHKRDTSHLKEKMQAAASPSRRPRSDPEKRVNISRLFINPVQLSTYTMKFQNRKLLNPNYMDCDMFLQQGFTFPLLIKNQGLEEFVSMHNTYYGTLVKAFYCNLDYENCCITSNIAGKEIVITEDLWSAVAGLKKVGHTIMWSRIKEVEGYDKLTAIRDMLIDPTDIPSGRDFQVGRLKIEDRLLHYAIARIIDARDGNFARVSEKDIFLMWAFKNNYPINWPQYYAEKMYKVAQDYNTALPLICFVSQIIKYYQAFTIDDGLTAVHYKYGYNMNTLAMMGLEKKRDGNWVRTSKKGKETSTSVQPNYDSGNEPDSPQGEPIPMELPQQEETHSEQAPVWFTNAMGNLQHQIDHHFERLNLRMTRMEDHLNIPPFHDPYDPPQ